MDDLAALKFVLQYGSPTPNCVALVSQSWHQLVAAAATSSIDIERCADADSLQQWLQRHGSNLTKLRLGATAVGQLPPPPLSWAAAAAATDGAAADGAGGGAQLTALPCPNLTELLLCGATGNKLRLGSSVMLRDIPAATRLTSLVLEDLELVGKWWGVSNLPNLKHWSGMLWPKGTC